MAKMLRAEGNDLKVNAVAVTANRALSALHGLIEEKSPVELRGKRRKGTVILSRFMQNEVDMALIQLIADETPFDAFIEIRRIPVRLGQQLAIIGLTPNSRDEATVYFDEIRVTVIDAGALFQSTYSARCGLSGSSVIISMDSDGFHVVGVPVGTEDDIVSPPPIKKARRGSLNCLFAKLHEYLT